MMEMLRAYSATSHQRICANDVQVAGVQLKAGDRVLLPIALAGRDPEQYEHPNEIRFDRNASNMTFGFGIHRCLGVYLAQRSEEHTSELQSLMRISYAVFCLKKKNNKPNTHNT